VVGAVLDIVRERAPESMNMPGAAEVAERAGVSERTVFRHFADLDSLFLAAAARQRPAHDAYLRPRPDAPDVAIHLSRTRPIVLQQLEQAHAAARAQVGDVFAPELSRLDVKRRTLMLDALDLATSWTCWDTLRAGQGCSVDRTRKVITETVTALLATVPKAKRR